MRLSQGLQSVPSQSSNNSKDHHMKEINQEDNNETQ